MTKFTVGFKKIDADFKKRGIPTDAPGFCDHPAFLQAEQDNPSFLNNYAAFVATKPYTDEYLQHASNVITNVTNILFKELEKHGRLGACVDISGILSRILEKEGIWNCGIKGSLTITFPEKSNEDKTYFWSVDHGEFTAAHAWLLAPPFSIVDVAIKKQPYSGKKADYLPNIILTEQGKITNVDINDIISPEAQMELKMHGVPRDEFFQATAPQLQDIVSVFPALEIECSTNAILKYCPVAIHTSDLPLEGMRNMEFDGKTPIELYDSLFKNKCQQKNA